MFSKALILALSLLSVGRTSDGYIERQEALARELPAAYEDLVDVAYDYEDASIRIEAIEIISILKRDEYKTVLSDLMKADPDERVRKHAEGLLFRAIVNEQRLK